MYYRCPCFPASVPDFPRCIPRNNCTKNTKWKWKTTRKFALVVGRCFEFFLRFETQFSKICFGEKLSSHCKKRCNMEVVLWSYFLIMRCVDWLIPLNCSGAANQAVKPALVYSMCVASFFLLSRKDFLSSKTLNRRPLEPDHFSPFVFPYCFCYIIISYDRLYRKSARELWRNHW